MRRSHNPLPNITEVPGSEVPDSSSFHSNESNESQQQKMLLMPPSKCLMLLSSLPGGYLPRCYSLPLPVLGPIDPARDIETLNEEELESECVPDSEYEGSEQQSVVFDHNTSIPILNPLESESEDYRFSSGTFVVECYES